MKKGKNMKAFKNLLDLAAEAAAEFLEGKTIKEAHCCEFGLALTFGDNSTMTVGIDSDIADDPFFRYELDGRNPYTWKREGDYLHDVYLDMQQGNYIYSYER